MTLLAYTYAMSKCSSPSIERCCREDIAFPDGYEDAATISTACRTVRGRSARSWAVISTAAARRPRRVSRRRVVRESGSSRARGRCEAANTNCDERPSLRKRPRRR